MKTNLKVKTHHLTHEGGPAACLSPLKELEKTISCCLLWEDTFYESGNSIAGRIEELCKQVSPLEISRLAIAAREQLYLRHVPLFLCKQLAKRSCGKIISETLFCVIQRADELSEFVSLYWKEGKRPLSAQVKKGLAKAFTKFNAYQLAKYNRDEAVKLRDVLFLCHGKPKDEEQARVWKKLIDGTLESPDTWEVSLSAGKNKKETFTRLLSEGKLGYFALLRNLRKMEEVGVDRDLVARHLVHGSLKPNKILPFRYLAALKHAPYHVGVLDAAMLNSCGHLKELPGNTFVLIDVSGSMDAPLSSKSDMTRIEAASAMGILARELCPAARVFTFSDQLVEVPAFRGLALVDSISKSQDHHGTQLSGALETLKKKVKEVPDRIIIITDEQSSDGIIPNWSSHGYILNVASYQPGLQTGGGWKRINGFSERVLDWMRIEESDNWESAESNET